METKQENVIPTDYAEVMQKSYIDYAMSVIASAAGCPGRTETGTETSSVFNDRAEQRS